MSMDAVSDRADSLAVRIGGLGVAYGLQRLMRTVDIKITHHDRTVDPALPEFTGRAIYVFWHEYISVPITLWQNYSLALLVSRHKDADWLIRAAHHLGLNTVRGSTNRGGSAAIRELQRQADEFDFVITPDGPRGPRREMALGPIFLASRFQRSIIPVGFGYDRPWRMRTWDRFAIPRPGSRGRVLFGPRIDIPRKLKRGGLERYRQYLESALNEVTRQAEDWAAGGHRMAGQIPFRRVRKAYDPVRNGTSDFESKTAIEDLSVARDVA